MQAGSQVIVLIPFRVQCALDGVCGVALARSVHHHLGKRIRQACGRTQRAPRSHFGLRLRGENTRAARTFETAEV